MAAEATSGAVDMFSPGRCSLDIWCFSSAPTTETSNGDVSSEFEFETTRHFVHELEKESLPDKQRLLDKAPAVAFADELCRDGTLMPVSLIPPPRLRGINGKGPPLSPARSPKSPARVLKVLFKRQSWAGDDFDPFMAALENVKEENEGNLDGCTQGWAQPMSPLWAESPKRSYDDCMPRAHQSGLTGKETPVEQLAEPKGVLLARQSRLVKMGYEKPKKTKSKKQKIKRFIIRTITVGRGRRNEDKQKDNNLAVTMKTSSFKSMAVTGHDDAGGESESEMTKLPLVPSRQKSPNLLLCMGYGAKFVK